MTKAQIRKLPADQRHWVRVGQKCRAMGWPIEVALTGNWPDRFIRMGYGE